MEVWGGGVSGGEGVDLLPFPPCLLDESVFWGSARTLGTRALAEHQRPFTGTDGTEVRLEDKAISTTSLGTEASSFSAAFSDHS